MSDPGIKLFGRTIQTFSAESRGKNNKIGCFSWIPQTDELVEEQSLKGRLKGINLATVTNGPFSGNNDAHAFKTEERQEVGVLHDKSFKKPERILQCPRCNSVDTKFCYYNNYNTNQPRHFCKNCQRYWTAGGTMRNVPVGAGRRKNKNVVAQFQNCISEALHKVEVNHTQGTSLKFSSDAPLCESMVSSLNVGDKKSLSNEFSQTGEQESCVSLRSKECHSSESSVATPKDVVGKRDLQEQVPNGNRFPSQVQCFPGAPWPYPCHSVKWSSAPAFAYASFPMPSSYSTAPQFVGCTMPSLCTGPWIIPPASTALCSGGSSPTLGKHSRDDSSETANFGKESPKERTSEPILWVPKTSRIDDTSELTKSSIMSKLGIKEDGADSVGSSSLFKSFKGQFKNKGTLGMNSSPVLQANPAAFSRAITFHESS